VIIFRDGERIAENLRLIFNNRALDPVLLDGDQVQVSQ
jgi:hypothetical protein